MTHLYVKSNLLSDMIEYSLVFIKSILKKSLFWLFFFPRKQYFSFTVLFGNPLECIILKNKCFLHFHWIKQHFNSYFFFIKWNVLIYLIKRHFTQFVHFTFPPLFSILLYLIKMQCNCFQISKLNKFVDEEWVSFSFWCYWSRHRRI